MKLKFWNFSMRHLLQVLIEFDGPFCQGQDVLCERVVEILARRFRLRKLVLYATQSRQFAAQFGNVSRCLAQSLISLLECRLSGSSVIAFTGESLDLVGVRGLLLLERSNLGSRG